ncbi:MAG TPA: CDP-diacylglycerol--glycerol-3-phosphate 3-phosphatidyltransferase [Candidatus Binataceae bacterium]|nr:CDP-diacylglycerol--glycerol-3-phosphate 3-phosphatidyltransferase [Candidatus Binataceae bacterium]
MLFTTPNLLTLSRIAAVPVIIVLLLYPGPSPSAIAAAVFLVASLTDFLDGYIARNYDSGTMLGKFLDPIADKLVVMSALIMLAGIPRTPRVPAWIVAVLMAREVLITGLRAIAAVEGEIIGADELGKYKMALQCIALEGLLIHYTYWHVDFFAAGMLVLWLSLILSLWSGVEYFVKARGIFAGEQRMPRPKRAVAQ